MNDGAGRSSIEILPDPDALASAAARQIARLAGAALAARDCFAVALSGGSTPLATYRRLAAEHIDWSRVHLFWSDERCVPPDDPQSNYGAAQDALLDRIDIPPANVHRIHGEDAPLAAADDYEQTLQGVLAARRPPLDLVLLGLGRDGHTGSLFPDVLDQIDATAPTRRVAAVRVAALDAWRITLTPSAINAAAHVMFLVSGRDKAAIVRDVMRGARGAGRLPAQRIGPVAGTLAWYLDAAAAQRLAD